MIRRRTLLGVSTRVGRRRSPFRPADVARRHADLLGPEPGLAKFLHGLVRLLAVGEHAEVLAADAERP